MGEYFTRDYHGAPFELFGPAHLTALVIVFIILVSVVLLRKRFSERQRIVFRYTVAAI